MVCNQSTFRPLSSNRNRFTATVRAWSQEFHGTSAELLYGILKSYIDVDDVYARFVPLIQSLGTGKSRMVDQLGKRIIYIPLNLLMDLKCTFTNLILIPSMETNHPVKHFPFRLVIMPSSRIGSYLRR